MEALPSTSHDTRSQRPSRSPTATDSIPSESSNDTAPEDAGEQEDQRSAPRPFDSPISEHASRAPSQSNEHDEHDEPLDPRLLSVMRHATLLQQHAEQTRLRLRGVPRKVPLLHSSSAPQSSTPSGHWSRLEKALLYPALARRSRWRLDLVAVDINAGISSARKEGHPEAFTGGGKTEVQVALYLARIEAGKAQWTRDLLATEPEYTHLLLQASEPAHNLEIDGGGLRAAYERICARARRPEWGGFTFRLGEGSSCVLGLDQHPAARKVSSATVKLEEDVARLLGAADTTASEHATLASVLDNTVQHASEQTNENPLRPFGEKEVIEAAYPTNSIDEVLDNMALLVRRIFSPTFSTRTLYLPGERLGVRGTVLSGKDMVHTIAQACLPLNQVPWEVKRYRNARPGLKWPPACAHYDDACALARWIVLAFLSRGYLLLLDSDRRTLSTPLSEEQTNQAVGRHKFEQLVLAVFVPDLLALSRDEIPDSTSEPMGMSATEIRARLVIVARHVFAGPGTLADTSLMAGLINSASISELWSMRLVMREHRASGTHYSEIQDPTYDSLESNYDSGSGPDSDQSSELESPKPKLLPIPGTGAIQESSSSEEEEEVVLPRKTRARKPPPTRRERTLERDDPDRIDTSEEVSGASDRDSSSDSDEYHPRRAVRARSTPFQDVNAAATTPKAEDDIPVRGKERWLYPDAKVGSLP